VTLLTLNLREWKALETVAARTTDAHILRRERLRKAGVLSGNFWLTKGLFCQRTF
jgi:hypothetical protein